MMSSPGQPRDPLRHPALRDEGGARPASAPPGSGSGPFGATSGGSSPSGGSGRPSGAGADSSGPDDITRAASSSGPAHYVGDVRPEVEGYDIYEELHRGGQGVVYRALQLGTKREVALKVLLEGPFAGEDARRRFEREIELAASLRHPNIVTILDSGVFQGRYFYAMEYIRGEHLGRWFRSARPSKEQAVRLFERICAAVNFAHLRGVIHRDLKPSNILVDEEGEPHVLDFGLAKPLPTGKEDQSTVRLLSTAGQVIGTIAYMSPEQAASPHEVDVRSDVYALGVIFYEMLVGESPYPVSGTLAEVLTHIANTDPTPPHTLRRSSAAARAVDDELETILLKALEKEPGRRYQTAGELGRDLRRYLDGEPIEAKRASGFYVFKKTLRRYRMQAGAAGIILMLIMASLVGFAVMYHRESNLRLQADESRATAMEKARRAAEAQAAERLARQEAEATARQLRASMVAQRIQRGDLARERGDLAVARDAYWDAYAETPIASALWHLRRHFLESGEIASHQLYVSADGPTAVAPDGHLAAVANSPTGVSVQNVETGAGLAWRPMPDAVTALNIRNDGVIAAAGRGWARVFAPDSLRPVAAVELPREFAPDTIHMSERAEWLYALDGERLYVCSTGADGRSMELRLQGPRTGPIDFENRPDRMAVPTAAGVELISLDDSGQPRSEVIWKPAGSPARAAHFAGEDLLAVLSNVIDTVRLGGGLHGQQLQFLRPAGSWDMLDLRRGVGLLALGSRDGRIAVYRSGTLFREWRVTQGTLHELHFADDAGTLVTRDGRGTLTHWAALDPPGRTRLASMLASDWAISGDGSTAAIVTTGGPVALYRPREDGGLAFVAGGRRFTRASLNGRESSVSLSNDGTLLLQHTGPALNLSSTDDIAARWSANWSNSETPVLRDALLSPDGLMIAVHAESRSGHQRQIGFYEPVTPRRAPADEGRGELAPLGPAAMLAGSPVTAIRFRPDSHELIVARANGDLAVIAPGAGKLMTWTALESPAYALAFDRDGHQLAVACEDGLVRLLNFDTTELRGRFNVVSPVVGMQFSPDGGLLMVRTEEGTLRLFELLSGELVLRWMLPEGGERPLAAWMAPDTLLLAYDGRLNAHRLAATDVLIQANRRYPAQRPVIDAMEDGNFAAAWRQAARLREVNEAAGALAQQEILESMLSRRATPVPQEWIDPVVEADDAAMLLRLGHAAYNGRRYAAAREWLRRGAVLLSGKLDAYTLWRIAQCDYLEEQYYDAARLLRELPTRSDFDALDIPRVHLELAAALFMAGYQSEAAQIGLRVGRVERVVRRNNPIAVFSAANIGKYVAGAMNEGWLISTFTSLLTMVAEGSLDVRDDPYFFFGEVARRRGEYPEALAQYQRCIETARDTWPSNWAALRIEQMTRKGPPTPGGTAEEERGAGDAW